MVLDSDVLPFEITAFLEALTERGHITRSDFRSPRVEKHDHRHRRLLRARHARPRRRAAECSQQFPPSDGDCHTPLPCEVRNAKIPRHERAVLTARHLAQAKAGSKQDGT